MVEAPVLHMSLSKSKIQCNAECSNRLSVLNPLEKWNKKFKKRLNMWNNCTLLWLLTITLILTFETTISRFPLAICPNDEREIERWL